MNLFVLLKAIPDTVEELTNRVTQVEVRDKLVDMARKAGEDGAIDVLLGLE